MNLEAERMIERAAEAIFTMMQDGVEKAMNRYNRREAGPG